MKIYTRTGDSGETALFGGGRVRKNHLRVETYGEVDELNAAIGMITVILEENGATRHLERLRTIQEDLFAIGAHLATPDTESNKAAQHLPALPTPRIEQMEAWMDEADLSLEPLQNFILAGGTEAAARSHLARSVCRRAERRVIAMTEEDPVEAAILIYLNRLSDYLFMLARLANREAGVEDVPWRGRAGPAQT